MAKLRAQRSRLLILATSSNIVLPGAVHTVFTAGPALDKYVYVYCISRIHDLELNNSHYLQLKSIEWVD